ncbi:hypothetical protein Bca52824_014958 [Brassica carinata]|uniref:Uncharacterized protein n=1 Tax=Brassica carinata TaxID=52824 RepID=A0A8X8B3X8_BRACI|nr:hypothetical protein Bca52824_014958 [Brassica carinata]
MFQAYSSLMTSCVLSLYYVLGNAYVSVEHLVLGLHTPRRKKSRAIKWKTSSLLPHLFTIVRPSLSGKNMASTSEHLLEHQNARAGVQSPKEIFIEIFSYLKPIIAEFYPSVNSIASVSAAVWFT